MARTRPRLELFPNLLHLQWGSNLFDCLLFVHPRLHSLSIVLPSNFVAIAPDFSSYLAHRLPNMEVLSFTAVFPINGVDEALNSTIRDLSGLRVVHLPTAPTKRVLETLSQLPSLGKVTLRPFQGTPSIRDIGDLKFETDAFASLRDITLSLPYFAATKLILHPNFPTYLTHVQIESPSVESPAHFSDLLGAISGRNGSMTSVRVVCLSMAGSTRPEQGDFINMRHIRPVLKCTKIRSLELAHYYPLDLIPADLEEIASAFPHLETLVLNCSPADITPPGVTPLPISSILALTRCPELQRLGLYFSTSSELIPRNAPNTFFSHFKSLLVGKSTVTNPRALAFFLSHLCPRLTNVVTGTDWMQDDREPPAILSPEWEEFAKWLPLLSEIRAEERAWTQHQLRGLRGKLTASASD
ncbi:hypothetical protein ONZ45_g1143 [Pleurotus djamor]|nr:hypothetical protein ONZ45_g1143 [Pleurotus djamor]